MNAASPNKVSPNQPIAYQKGVQDFYGRDFIVAPSVLIPRPETEQLIDIILNLAGKPHLPGIKPPKRVLPENPVILDVGTGSGCIAITLKLELPESEIYASDISPAALKIAQKNATKQGASIHLIISHLLEKVKTGDIPTPNIIVANLPYVDENWDWLDKESLSYEPQIALYAKDHGLALIKELVNEATELQIPRLILEADPCQHASIVNYATKKGFKLIEARGFALYLSL